MVDFSIGVCGFTGSSLYKLNTARLAVVSLLRLSKLSWKGDNRDLWRKARLEWTSLDLYINHRGGFNEQRYAQTIDQDSHITAM